eukprot:3941801-Rhodomonas_salina.4
MARYGITDMVSPNAFFAENENPSSKDSAPTKRPFTEQSHVPVYELVAVTLSICVSTTKPSVKHAYLQSVPATTTNGVSAVGAHTPYHVIGTLKFCQCNKRTHHRNTQSLSTMRDYLRLVRRLLAPHFPAAKDVRARSGAWQCISDCGNVRENEPIRTLALR